MSDVISIVAGEHALEKANHDLAAAWDLAMVLDEYLMSTHIAECMRAATLAREIVSRVSAAYEITVDIKPK